MKYMKRTRMSGAAALAALAGVAAITPVATAAPQDRSTASPTVVRVKETEFRIALNRGRVPAGRVTFVTGNDGKALHELVILRTSRGAAKLGRLQKISEAGLVAETGDLRRGQAKTLTVRLTPGHYSLVCNLVGHYSAGMHADFTVA